MKKSIYIALVFVFIFSPFFVFAQEMDTVVLLDTSESMFPYFQSTIDYLIQDIIKNQLKEGDTFHLLTFDNQPDFEISRKLRNSKDIQDILSRVLLLQPLGKYTDLIAALVYVNNYTNDLPSITKKRILILTDGVNDPPPGSMYKNNTATLKEKIQSITANMKRKGWDVSLIRFPLSSASGSAGSSSASRGVDIFPELSKELNTKIIPLVDNNTTLSHKATGDPLIIFPGDLGKVQRLFSIPFKVKNFSEVPVQLKLKSISWNNNNILKKETSVKVDAESTAELNALVELKPTMEEKKYTIPVVLSFSNDMRPYPRTGSITFNLIVSKHSFINSSIFKVVIIIAALLLLFLMLLFIIKKTAEASLTRGQTRGTEAYKNKKILYHKQDISEEEKKHLYKQKKETSTPVAYETHKVHEKDFVTSSPKKVTGTAYEMIIDSQNRRIGTRNVQWFSDGSVFTLGGTRADDYFIFIYPVDHHIAEIFMEKGTLYFKIINKDYFPDIKDSIVPLKNRVLRAVSSDGRVFNLKIEKWISPLDKINRILHLIDHPGTPDFRY